MTTFNYVLSALDLLASTTPASPDDVLERTGKSLELMTGFANQPNGLSQLVERYGSHQSVVLLRPLSFLLSQAANNDQNKPVYHLVCMLLQRRTCDDATVLTNLFTALHRLAIGEKIPDSNGLLPSGLFAFIRLGLTAEVGVISAALGFLGRLHDDDTWRLFTPEEQSQLTALLTDLWSYEHEVIRLDLTLLQLPGRPK